MTDRSINRQRRVYRSLLLFYPGSFRRDYGELMSQAFCDRLLERGAPRTWVLVGADLWQSVPQQIMEASLMSNKWMGSITTLAAVALVTLFAIGTGPPLVLALSAVAVVGMLGFMATRRNDRPTEYLFNGTAPKRWTWWTVLAAALGAVYVLAATGQLIDDPKATNVGALGIMIGFAGLIALGLRLRSKSKVGGNWMVIFATVPALLFFWVVLPTIVGLAIIIGAIAEIARATPQAPAAA
jgi:hypothetical protein